MFRRILGRYLIALVAATVAVLLAVVAVYALMDPQRIIGTPDIAGVNAFKPYLEHHQVLSRWRMATRLCPTAGIFGNSRAEIGFDPLHPAFDAAGVSAFNHAVPGSGIELARDQLAWLRASGCRPKIAVIGVDFVDFLADAGIAAKTAVPDPAPIPQTGAREIVEVMLSTTAIGDAWATLSAQRDVNSGISTARGLNPLRNYAPEVERFGAYGMFRQRAEENARNWQRLPRSVRTLGGAPAEDFLVLQSILDEAAADGTAIDLVLYPYHAELRLILARMGFADAYDDWKRTLTAMVAAAKSRGINVALWDFAVIAPATSEPVPMHGDRTTKVAGYWEGGHFKRELGDAMLDQILRGRPGFGVRLEPANVEAVLASDRAAVANLRHDTALDREVTDILATIPADPKGPVRMPAPTPTSVPQ